MLRYSSVFSRPPLFDYFFLDALCTIAAFHRPCSNRTTCHCFAVIQLKLTGQGTGHAVHHEEGAAEPFHGDQQQPRVGKSVASLMNSVILYLTISTVPSIFYF